MQTYIYPFEQKNNHTWLMHKILYRNSFNAAYKPPNEVTKINEPFCDDGKNLKNMILVGDFNIKVKKSIYKA